jgi:hypothetical protein
MRVRTARLLLAGYLGLIIYIDMVSGLARNGVAPLPLAITDYYLSGEVSVTTHLIALGSIVFLFVILKQRQANSV